MSAHPHPRPLSRWRGRGEGLLFSLSRWRVQREEPRANLEAFPLSRLREKGRVLFSLSRLRERAGVRVVE